MDIEQKENDQNEKSGQILLPTMLEVESMNMKTVKTYNSSARSS